VPGVCLGAHHWEHTPLWSIPNSHGRYYRLLPFSIDFWLLSYAYSCTRFGKCTWYAVNHKCCLGSGYIHLHNTFVFTSQRIITGPDHVMPSTSLPTSIIGPTKASRYGILSTELMDCVRRAFGRILLDLDSCPNCWCRCYKALLVLVGILSLCRPASVGSAIQEDVAFLQYWQKESREKELDNASSLSNNHDNTNHGLHGIQRKNRSSGQRCSTRPDSYHFAPTRDKESHLYFQSRRTFHKLLDASNHCHRELYNWRIEATICIGGAICIAHMIERKRPKIHEPSSTRLRARHAVPVAKPVFLDQHTHTLLNTV